MFPLYRISMGAVAYSGFAAEFTRKDVVHFLSNRDDPEVDSAIKSFLRTQYANAEKGTLIPEAVAGDGLEFTAQVERKYVAAQIVESSIQVGVDCCFVEILLCHISY
jgi:hypothetical protein